MVRAELDCIRGIEKGGCGELSPHERTTPIYTGVTSRSDNNGGTAREQGEQRDKNIES